MNSNRSKACSKIPRRRNNAGIALLSVLWILLLLSVLAGTAMYVARTNAILTHRALELAQAQAVADAAIVDAVSGLSDEQTSRRPTINDSHSWEFNGKAVVISITRESGRIDVNTADRNLVLAFLQSRGLRADTASFLVDELRSTRITDDSPRNPPLEAIEELTRLPGWNAQPLACWMDSLTVYSGLPSLTMADATPMTLAALQWAKAHDIGNAAWAQEQSLTSGTATQASAVGEVLRIRATAAISTDVAATSEWVGRITGDRSMPMLTMRWDHLGARMDARCGAPL